MPVLSTYIHNGGEIKIGRYISDTRAIWWEMYNVTRYPYAKHSSKGRIR